jgi:REP element-mobilizing transposase RayT
MSPYRFRAFNHPMSHTYSHNLVHIVFSTKDRRKLIPAHFQPKLWRYMAGTCQKQKILVHSIGGTEDHIHVLLQIPATLPLAKAVLLVKSNSTRWANQGQEKLVWQEGYAAFSVSASIAPAVVRYIHSQRLHHQRLNFEGEFVSLLRRHGVAFDARFVFG